MKRIFSYILILAVILQIFAPFTVGVNQKNIIAKNTAEAAISNLEQWDKLDGFTSAFSSSTLSVTGTTLKPNAKSGEMTDAAVTLQLTLDTGVRQDQSSVWYRIIPFNVVGLNGYGSNELKLSDKSFILLVKDASGNVIGYKDITYDDDNITGADKETGLSSSVAVAGKNESKLPVSLTKAIKIISFTPLNNSGVSSFKKESTYSVELWYKAVTSIDFFSTLDNQTINKTLSSNGKGNKIIGDSGEYFLITNSGPFTTASQDQITTGNGSDEGETTVDQGGDKMPDCGFGNLSGCLAQIIYYLIFKPTSFVFGLAGKLMDVSLMYSLSDSSYKSTFISEGWQIARGLCNMFFIFILLYIAFTTILNTVGVKGKASIINVIIIGLVINFSLFATQVVIDASNVLARVFYNPKVMVIGPKDASGNVQGKTGQDYGEIKLSEAIVSKVDPQVLLSETKNVTSLGKKIKGESESNIGAGSFILIALLASAVNVFGTVAFLGITLAFVGRVIGLWLSMILSPIAFFTFMVPQLKNKEQIGWNSWWSNLISTAFMAPIFVFFMYIIVMFLEKKLGFTSLSSSSLTGMSKIISIILPFILIIFLINKAKKIAIKMSGEIGEGMASVSQKITGLAATAATGGVLGAGAMAMRGTVGKLGSSMFNSEKLKGMESKGGISGFVGKNLRNIGDKTSKGSFDFRNTTLGKGASSSLGKQAGFNLGKSGGVGGFVKESADREKAKVERAKTLELGVNSEEVKDLRSKEEAARLARIKIGEEAEEKAKKDIVDARTALNDAETNYHIDPSEENNQKRLEAKKKFEEEKQNLENIKNGGKDKNGNYQTDNGKITKEFYDKAEKERNEAEAKKNAIGDKEASLRTDAEKTKERKEEEQAAQDAHKKTMDKAKEDFDKAEAEAIKEEEEMVKASVANSKANIEKANKEYHEAMKIYLQAENTASLSATPENIAIRESAKANMKLAKDNIDTVEKDNENRELVDKDNAEKRKEKKIAEAATTRDNTFTKADTDKNTAMNNAQKKEQEMIDKAKEDFDKAEKAYEEAKASSDNGTNFGKSIKALDKEVRDAKKKVTEANNQIKIEYANTVKNQVLFDTLISGGTYRQDNADRASHDIIMSTKPETK